MQRARILIQVTFFKNLYNMANGSVSKVVLLDLVRASYTHVETPKDFGDGKGAKYMSNFLVPKNTPDAQRLIEAAQFVQNAPENRAIFGAWTQNHKWPIYDGDQSDDASTKGCWVIKVKSDRRPALWDATVGVRGGQLPVAQPNAIYSGCYVAVEIALYPFNKMMKGIAIVFGGGGLCKRKDGEEFGGSAPISQDAATQRFGQFIPEGAPSFGGQAPQGQGYQAPQGQGYQGQGYQAPQGQGYQGQAPQGQGYQAPQGQGYPGQPIPDEFA